MKLRQVDLFNDKVCVFVLFLDLVRDCKYKLHSCGATNLRLENVFEIAVYNTIVNP